MFVVGWMRGQCWGQSEVAGSCRIERVVNVKYCAATQLCVCVCRFHTRGYPNKPLECQVTCRRFLCLLLADFTELLGGQCTLGVRVCSWICVRDGAENIKVRKREGENLLGWHSRPRIPRRVVRETVFFYLCACDVKISIRLQEWGSTQGVCVSDTSVFSESIRPCALLTNIWERDNCRECENILESGRLRIGREAQRMFHKFCLFFLLRILQEGGWKAQNKILSSNHQAPCMCWNVLGNPSEGDHLMNDGPCFPVFLSDSTCQRDWLQMEHRTGSVYMSSSSTHICVCVWDWRHLQSQVQPGVKLWET